MYWNWKRRAHTTEQSRIQKLHCIQKLVFRNYFVVFGNYFVVFRNSCIQKLFRRIQKLFSSYSETISSYSETISSYSETIFVVFRNYFVVFRNYFRRIQKLFSSYSETIFVVFRNFYSRTRGQCEQSHAWTVDAFSCIQGGVGGWAGAVSFRRWLRGPMLSWVRVGWGGGGGVGQGH